MSRLIVPRIAILLLFVVLVGRLYELQLVDSEANRLRSTAGDLTMRFLQVRPLRGEVFASDGRTVLAESVPIYNASIRPSDLPAEADRTPAGQNTRDVIFARLGQLLVMSSTLTISPAAALDTNGALRSDLSQGLGAETLARALPGSGGQLSQRSGQQQESDAVQIEVPPDKSMVALRLRDAYSDTLTLANPIAARVNRRDIPGYQTLVVKRDIPREVALVLRENASSLPGVVVERDYRRQYPLSNSVSSLSHLLGHIGRIDACELVSENPARTWVSGLLDSIGHAVECGVLQKQINPYQLGIPRYLEDDRIGKDGVEASYEDALRGQLGVDSIVVDATGRPVRAPQVVQPARDGDNLVLTIDAGFQKQVEQILQNWIDISEQRRLASSGVFAYKRNYAPIRSGVAIVSEVGSGRILAMVSLPSYDNNIWVDPGRTADLQSVIAPPTEQYTETRRLAVLTNRALAFTYPPGSTLKQFDAAIALQNGIIQPDTRVADKGTLVLQDRYNEAVTYTFRNSNSRPWNDINVSDALKVSSNIFFMSVVGGNKDQIVNLSEEQKNIDAGLGITKFKEGLNWFGFGEPTGIRLPNEQQGVVPTPRWKDQVLNEPWTTGDLYNMSIGQGNMTVTPLQLVTAGAAVANNGMIYRPQIVDSIVRGDGTVVKRIGSEVLRQVPVDPAYLAVVREGMRRSVTEGANRAAQLACSGLEIAGKTGTAEFGPLLEVPNPNGRGTQFVQQSHSWFVGFAPYDNPQIEVVVIVEGTGDLGDGSATIAVPAVTQIMQAYFNITPPGPLPRECQQDLPPLPARMSFPQ